MRAGFAAQRGFEMFDQISGPITVRAVVFDMVVDEDDIIEEVDEIKPVMRDEECSGPNGVGC